jgi:methylenetetrahydrofolate dehydrogenase (NADP+)/methenyltetrahydrofolate cyclohydrolase
MIIDGKAIAAKVRGEVAAKVAERVAAGKRAPGLAVVLVGADPASQIYVRNKSKACREAGLVAFDHHLPAETTQDALLSLIAQLNTDDAVDGILVQLPLPKHIDSERVLLSISPDKDVDGFHPDNVGRLWTGKPRFVPCTPLGVMRLLAEAGCDPSGKDAVVVGRSNIVGRPMAALLINASATVTVAHSKSADLPAIVGRAEIVVAAVGKANIIRGSWVKPGALVIDVGMNRSPDGKLCGDVEYAAAAERAAAITPVPGGVGPMTIACLLANTLQASSLRC